jgi:hypothetical protein
MGQNASYGYYPPSVLWSVGSAHLCQVLGCGLEACPGDVVIDVVVEGA